MRWRSPSVSTSASVSTMKPPHSARIGAPRACSARRSSQSAVLAASARGVQLGIAAAEIDAGRAGRQPLAGHRAEKHDAARRRPRAGRDCRGNRTKTPRRAPPPAPARAARRRRRARPAAPAGPAPRAGQAQQRVEVESRRHRIGRRRQHRVDIRRASAAVSSPRWRSGTRSAGVARQPAQHRQPGRRGDRAGAAPRMPLRAGEVQRHRGDRQRPDRTARTPAPPPPRCGRCRRCPSPAAPARRAAPRSAPPRPAPLSKPAPSNRPITPSITAMSAPAQARTKPSRTCASSSIQESRLRQGRPAARAVVAGVDVVGAAFERLHDQSAPPQRADQPGGQQGLADPRAGAGHHDPRDAPASRRRLRAPAAPPAAPRAIPAARRRCGSSPGRPNEVASRTRSPRARSRAPPRRRGPRGPAGRSPGSRVPPARSPPARSAKARRQDASTGRHAASHACAGCRQARGEERHPGGTDHPARRQPSSAGQPAGGTA